MDFSKIKDINEFSIPSSGLFPDFDYESFVSGSIASPIHGDLQYDNVIIDGNKIVLLDWRHDWKE